MTETRVDEDEKRSGRRKGLSFDGSGSSFKLQSCSMSEKCDESVPLLRVVTGERVEGSDRRLGRSSDDDPVHLIISTGFLCRGRTRVFPGRRQTMLAIVAAHLCDGLSSCSHEIDEARCCNVLRRWARVGLPQEHYISWPVVAEACLISALGPVRARFSVSSNLSPMYSYLRN